MVRLLCIVLIIIATAPSRAEPRGQRFVSIAFHDIVDEQKDVGPDSVTTKTLIQFFEWLKGTGWIAVSLDDLSNASRGVRRLPEKAILLTFDDGYESVYTRVYPLLKAYGYPAVVSLVGSWMEAAPGTHVRYGDEKTPRTTFISWSEAREMQASGLVEFASHSYDLHREVLANPQGNRLPAAVTWRYDPRSGRYEDDAQYAARIRADLSRSRALMEANLGRPPRAMTWPYGRYTGPALQIAKKLGFSFGLNLEPEPAYTSDLFAIHRYFPSAAPNLGDIVRNLRFEPERPQTLRIACLTLDAIAAAGADPAQDRALGEVIEGLRTLGANVVFIDAAADPAPQAALGEVYFPTRLRPLRQDLLGRATWQIRTRAGADVYLRLPLAAAAAAVGDANVPLLFGDMIRYARADGIVVDMAATETGPIVANRSEDIRSRRAALVLDRQSGDEKLGLTAFRAAAAIDPRLRLALALQQPVGPPAWADIALLPPSEEPGQVAALAGRLRATGWLRPDASARVAFSLPENPERQVESLRLAQRQGASAFALCPKPPTLPPGAALAAAFSAATYPYRP